MNQARAARSAVHAILSVVALVDAACDSSTAQPLPDSGIESSAASAAACTQASDCDWGELDHELTSSKDCVCIYGCPYLPLSKTTVVRRAAQYKKLCNPRTDGTGSPCGVDDCSAPGELSCEAMTCKAAP